MLINAVHHLLDSPTDRRYSILILLKRFTKAVYLLNYSVHNYFFSAVKKMRVTAKQVAEQAGVSPTTVSFVLNRVEGANISEATRARVLEAAQTLGYVPDAAARNLARGYSDNIALVLTQPHPQVFIDIYVPNVLTGVTQVMRQHGLRVLVELVDDVSQSDVCQHLIRSREVAGLLVQPYNPSADDIAYFRSLAEQGYPIVAFDLLDDAVPAIIMQHFDGIRASLGHLIGLGHQRIACIPYCSVDTNPHAARRLDVYRAMLREHNLPVDEALIQPGNYEPETGYAATLALLQLPQPPTAIYAMNDVMAFGALTALREQGVPVPQQIAVVGHDDIPLARYAAPPLTTVHAPEVLCGQLGAEALITLMTGRPLPARHQRIATRLVIRESCGYRQG